MLTLPYRRYEMLTLLSLAYGMLTLLYRRYGMPALLSLGYGMLALLHRDEKRRCNRYYRSHHTPSAAYIRISRLNGINFHDVIDCSLCSS